MKQESIGNASKGKGIRDASVDMIYVDHGYM